MRATIIARMLLQVLWPLLCVQPVCGLEITNAFYGPPGFTVQWDAKTDGRYEMEGTTNLAKTWSRWGRLVAKQNTSGWTDTGSSARAAGYYRVKIGRVAITNVKHWAYNIALVDTAAQRAELVGSHFDMYVIEPCVTEKGNEAFDIAGLISDIRAHCITQYHKNPIILAYSDIGQAEEWRWYWKSWWGVGNPEWIVSGDPDGWDECYPVAYWYDAWKDIVIYGTDGMSQVQASLDAGFDGIYMDWIEAFCDDDVMDKAAEDGTNTAVAMFDLIEEIRTYARVTATNANPEYLIVAQNASDLYQEETNRYEQLIDAIACEGIWWEGDDGFDDWDDTNGFNKATDSVFPGWTDEVLEYLQPMKGRLPIFHCEYAQHDIAMQVYTNPTYTTNGFIPYCTRRSLQKLSKTPYPWGYTPQDY